MKFVKYVTVASGLTVRLSEGSFSRQEQGLVPARSQSRNPQTINTSKHYDALCLKPSNVGKVMNEINYSTVGRRNSLELITNTLCRFH